MKRPDETPAISVQEHLKIIMHERSNIGNIETVKTKTIVCQRVK